MKIRPVYQAFHFSDQILTGEISSDHVTHRGDSLLLNDNYQLESFCFADTINNSEEMILPVLIKLKTADETKLSSWKENVLSGNHAYWANVNKSIDKLTGKKSICAAVGCKGTSKRFSPEVQQQAFDLGKNAALVGFTLLTGGLSGVMTKAAEGATSLKGNTMGILPGTEKVDANVFIQQVLPSGIGIARNYSIALACDVMVALNGGRGTMEEMCFALDFDRPVYSWNSWELDEVDLIKSEPQLLYELLIQREKIILSKL